MSTQSVPSRYQPSERVVDDRDRLHELYCQRGLTIREIANQYAEVGRSMVCDAIHDHGLTDEEEKRTAIEQGVSDFHDEKNTELTQDLVR
ncbi:hypothetical protein EXE43_24785, partial [Halorubrum sp. SS5]